MYSTPKLREYHIFKKITTLLFNQLSCLNKHTFSRKQVQTVHSPCVPG